VEGTEEGKAVEDKVEEFASVKQKQRNVSALLEDEADEESGSDGGPHRGDGDDDDDDDDDEGLDDYEKDDGFLVGDDEEEVVEEDPNVRDRKKSRLGSTSDGEDAGEKGSGQDDDEEDKAEDELAEEDYEIAGRARKRKRRLKKLGGSDASGKGVSGLGESKGGADDDNQSNKATTAEELQKKLFGHADLEDEVDDDKHGDSSDGGDLEGDGDDFDSASDDDEFNDFIDDTEVHRDLVTTEDMDDEQKRQAVEREKERLRRKKQKQKRKQKARAKNLHVSSSALREAQELFGDVDDMLRVYEDQKLQRVAPGDTDAREGRGSHSVRGPGDSGGLAKDVENKIEPAIMEAHFFTSTDNDIRMLDVPEGVQARGIHQANMMVDAADRARQSEWVYDNLMGLGYLNSDQMCTQVLEDGLHEEDKVLPCKEENYSRRVLVSKKRSNDDIENWRRDGALQSKVKKYVSNVIEHMQDRLLEVPVIATQHKEDCGELLNLREADLPDTTQGGEMFDLYSKKKIFYPEETVQADHRRVRRWDILWKVQSLTVKWLTNYKRTQKRLAAYTEMVQLAESIGNEELIRGLQSCIDTVQQNFSPQDLEDADCKFKLLQVLLEDASSSELQTKGIRRPGKTSQLSYWRKFVPPKLLKSMCISPEQFAENLIYGEKRHDPEPNSFHSPLELIESETSSTQQSGAEQILDTARMMLAVQLAAEPAVKRIVRESFRRNAQVSTKPKKAGSEIRDPFHIYGPVSYLENKELYTFKGAQWLYVDAAEQAGVLEVAIKLPEDVLEDELIKYFTENYVSSDPSQQKEWDYERKIIIKDCVYKHLLPSIEKETRNLLKVEAKEWACQQVRDEFWKTISVSPWQPDFQDGVDKGSVDKYVMSCVWGPGSHKEGGHPTTLAMLDVNGEIIDFMECEGFSGNLSNVKVDRIFYDKRYLKSQQDIRGFIIRNKPQVIALGTGSIECMKLEKILEEIINDILVNDPLQMKGGVDSGDIHVMYASQTIARLWANSSAAVTELADLPQNRRECVALARSFIDPLPIVCSLFSNNHEQEILGLNVHEVQQFLGKDEQVQCFEQCLITVVNQVGVDVNRLIQAPWKAHTLQYVSGLGPRKAAALLDSIKATGRIESRKQIKNFLGQKVFESAASKLIVNRDDVAANADLDELEELLDSTRIPPQWYDVARKISVEIIRCSRENDGGDNSKQKDIDPDEVVEKVLDKPDLVDKLPLSPEFIQKMNINVGDGDSAEGAGEDSKRDRKLSLSELIDICFELRSSCSEVRKHWTRPASNEEFNLVLAEVKDWIKPGRTCNGRVMYTNGLEDGNAQCEPDDSAGGLKRPFFLKGVVVQLDCGILAFLHDDCIEDDTKWDRSFDPPKRIPLRNMVIPVRIMKVSPTKRVISVRPPPRDDDVVQSKRPEELELFDIKLSNLSNDLMESQESVSRWEDFYCKDPAYKRIARTEQEISHKKKAALIKRPIRHPFFKNIDYHETVNYMKDKESGAFVFRPSSQGVGYISVTIKLAHKPNPILMNEQIREADKMRASGFTSLSLGKELVLKKIGEDDKFEDLDEIIGRFVEPIWFRFKEAKKFKKFVRGNEEEVGKQLSRDARKKATTCIAVSLDEKYPGFLRLSYVFSTSKSFNSKHERIEVLPSGFKFRGNMFDTVQEIYNHFKLHPNKYPMSRDAGHHRSSRTREHRQDFQQSQSYQGHGDYHDDRRETYQYQQRDDSRYYHREPQGYHQGPPQQVYHQGPPQQAYHQGPPQQAYHQGQQGYSQDVNGQDWSGHYDERQYVDSRASYGQAHGGHHAF